MNAVKTSELMSMLGLCDDIVTLVGQLRLRWYGHVIRKDLAYGIRKVLDVVIVGSIGPDRPRLKWKKRMEKGLLEMGVAICRLVG